MKFSIGSEFSREFTFEESRITFKLAEELNYLFNDKNYGKRIKKIYVGVVCVSKGFEPFFSIRPLKVMRNEPAIEYEFKLNFDVFKSSDKQERKRLLVEEFLKNTKRYLAEKTIKGFEKEQFIDDLENYFKEQKYLA